MRWKPCPRRPKFCAPWISQSDGSAACRKRSASDFTVAITLALGRFLLSAASNCGFSNDSPGILASLASSPFSSFLPSSPAAACLCSPSLPSLVPCPRRVPVCRPPSAVQSVRRAGGWLRFYAAAVCLCSPSPISLLLYPARAAVSYSPSFVQGVSRAEHCLCPLPIPFTHRGIRRCLRSSRVITKVCSVVRVSTQMFVVPWI